MVKRAVAIPVFVIAFALGIYQTVNMTIAAGVAVSPSLISLVPQELSADIVDRALRADPNYFEQRFLAAVLIAQIERRRDDAAATNLQRRLERFPETSDTHALRARLAALRGEHDLTFREAMQAHLVEIVHSEVAYAATRDLARAIAMQVQLVTSLQDTPTQREALADAYWHLGALENLASEKSAATAPLHRRRAKNAFVANVALTPLSGRALLSAAYAEFALGHLRESEFYFSNARKSDPSSASAYVGLARVAEARRQCDKAADYRRTAVRLEPRQSDVRALFARPASDRNACRS